jgi:probable HAF family extracellular repeat protein
LEKTMASNTDRFTSPARAAWWLPCLLGALSAAAAASAGPATSGAPAEALGAAAAPNYRVINLGAGSLSQIPVINAGGQVAFSLFDGSGSHAWFYDGRSVRNIGTLGGPTANAVGLNDAGQVAGYADTAAGTTHAFRWSARTGMTDLGVIRGGPNSQATAISRAGQVVGESDIGSQLEPVHAFLWTAAAGMQDLGSPFGDNLSLSFAIGINDAGTVAGDAELGAPSYDNHAFVWTQAGGMRDLGTLPGGATSYTVAIDTAGDVTGWADVPAGGNHVFLWSRQHGMQDLGTAGGTESYPIAMSANGQIAGVIDLANGYQHAMSWTRARGMIDLGTLGGSGSRALGVNTLGQVVGLASTGARSEPTHAFLWSQGRGMVDLNKRVARLPAGLWLEAADAIADSGAIVAETNAGLVLLKPADGPAGGATSGSAPGPLLGPIAGADMVKTGAPFSPSTSFVDDATAGSHSVSWGWGDGSSDAPLKANESGGTGSASAMHVYSRPGIYTVTAQVTDRAGNSASVSRDLVVVEPSAGAAAGIGALMSPPGAVRTAPAQSGKARFAFIAPAAGTSGVQAVKPLLLFGTGGFAMRSDSFRRVAAEGGSVRFEGSGRNHRGEAVSFSLVATSGAADAPKAGRFALKAWHTDPATRAQVVDYDSQAGRTGAAGVAGAAGATMTAGRIALQ